MSRLKGLILVGKGFGVGMELASEACMGWPA